MAEILFKAERSVYHYLAIFNSINLKDYKGGPIELLSDLVSQASLIFVGAIRILIVIKLVSIFSKCVL